MLKNSNRYLKFTLFLFSTLLLLFSIPTYAQVRGYIDRVIQTQDGAKITGWACDTGVNQSIPIHIYSGTGSKRTFFKAARANINNESAVNNLCKTSSIMKHRFRVFVTNTELQKYQGEPVYVYGISQNNPNLAVKRSGLFTFPSPSSKPSPTPVPVPTPTPDPSVKQTGLSKKIKSSPNDITIENEIVTIDTSADVGFITIKNDGVLKCDTNKAGSYEIKTDGIMVMGQGAMFECGTNTNPFNGRLTISLKKGKSKSGPGEAFVAVMDQGVLRLHGNERGTQWTKLEGTVQSGGASLRFIDTVNWNAGDTVAIASTSFDWFETETATVKSVHADGKGVDLSQPLGYRHLGVVENYNDVNKTMSYRAEVINLTRNIIIKTDGNINQLNQSQIGGHVMVMSSAKAYVSGVHFDRLGQMGRLGRYPFHWHRAGNVEGQYIKNSSITNSYQRCVTMHMTQNALVQNNVCYNHFGHGYFLEAGNEINNKIYNNVGMLSKKVPKGKELLESDNKNTTISKFAVPATFWISNPNNEVVGNVAAGSEGTGFWNAFVPFLSCDKECEVVEESKKANVFPAYQKTKSFNNNLAHTTHVGFTWDGAPTGKLLGNPRNPKDRAISIQHYWYRGYDNPKGPMPIFQNLESYKNIHTGLYYRGDRAEFRNLKVADSGADLFIAFNQVFKNTLVVGKSRSSTLDEYKFQYDNSKWKNKLLRGFITYDGPSEFDNLAFAGFPSQKVFINSGGKKEITPAPIHIFGGTAHYEHQFKNVSFEGQPLYKVKFASSYKDSGLRWADALNNTMIRDVDGSIYGRANEIIVPDFPTNKDSTCRVLQGGVAQALGCKYEMGVVHFGWTKMRSGYAKTEINFAVRRNDGAVYKTQSPGAPELNTKMGVILDKGYRYNFIFNKTIVQNPGFSFQAKSSGVVSPVLSFDDNKNCSRVLGTKVQLNSYNELVNYSGNKNAFFINANKIIFARLVTSSPVSTTKGYTSDPMIIECP